jgi:hypothetical protein
MEKLVYLFHKAADTKVTSDFAQRAGRDIVPQLKAAGARDILLTICDLNDEVRHRSPERLMGASWDTLAGAIYFWMDNLDDRFKVEPLLRLLTPQISGYLVTESVLQTAPRTWKSGERRPGVTQLAVIGKSSRVSDEEFYYNWQQIHSQFSFRLHPLRTEYIRNSVARTLTPGAVPYRIIVLEQWGDLRDFTEPERYIPNEAWEELRKEPEFADVDSLAAGPSSEYAFD